MREAVAAYRARTFKSLAVRNYRLYFIGQGISISGTWMQAVAQGLLVLELTGSGTQLGLVTALRSIPVLAFGAMGGVIADRYPKRKILYASQTMAGLLGLTLGILVATGEVQMWMVDILAVLLGFVSVVDNPTRQSLILELVGPDQIRNAVSLNSTEVNLARVIGPTLAGILVSTVGLAACFIVDGLSYFAVIVMLMRMREDEMFLGQTVSRARGQLREGFAYAWANLPVRKTLIMMAIIGTFTYEFNVILPIFAEFTFDSGPSAYAAMTAAMGLGAVVGGLSVAGRVRTSQWSIVISAALFGCSVLLTALGADALRRRRPAARGGVFLNQLYHDGKFDDSTRDRPDDARPGDGALDGFVSRDDSDRRTDHRRHRRAYRRSVGPARWRRCGADCRRLRRTRHSARHVNRRGRDRRAQTGLLRGPVCAIYALYCGLPGGLWQVRVDDGVERALQFLGKRALLLIEP